MELDERVYVRVQGARSDPAIQGHGKTGSLLGEPTAGFGISVLTTEVSQMTRASTNAVLQAAAKSLVWDLFAAAGYCRTRAFVNVEKFERELFNAVRQWRTAHANLEGHRRKYERSNQ